MCVGVSVRLSKIIECFYLTVRVCERLLALACARQAAAPLLPLERTSDRRMSKPSNHTDSFYFTRRALVVRVK